MNVSSTNSISMFQSTNSSSSSKSSSLSLDQQNLIEEVLSQYDSESLSADDASAIVEAFKEASIEPSQELASTMSSLGFDAKEIGDLAGAAQGGGGSRPMGPPPPKQEEISSVEELLESLLSSEEDDEDTTTSSLSSLLSGTGYDDESNSSLDTVLDYTSKIVRLKDDAKSDVMNMLNEYNADEANFTNKTMQDNLLSSLSQILSKPQNFNTISFYA